MTYPDDGVKDTKLIGMQPISVKILIVHEHTHPRGGRGAQEQRNRQRSIRRNLHGDEGSVQRELPATRGPPVNLLVDFLKEE